MLASAKPRALWNRKGEDQGGEGARKGRQEGWDTRCLEERARAGVGEGGGREEDAVVERARGGVVGWEKSCVGTTEHCARCKARGKQRGVRVVLTGVVCGQVGDLCWL